MQLRKFEPLNEGTVSQSVLFLNTYYRRERSLLPYMCCSCAMIAIFQSGLFFYKNLFSKNREDKLSQLIDIEFVSQADFKDKKNLLPASVPKPTLAKTTSPVIHSQGQIFTDPVFVVRAGGSQNNQREMEQEKQETQEKSQKREKQMDTVSMVADTTDLASRYLPMNAPISKNYKPLSVKSARIKRVENSDVSMNMEEVKPPEMVEVTENDGDTSYNHWQDGGRSNNGTGISSSLVEYLKELHKRLKHAWSPPPGTVHHIKVVFRLDANGALVSTQLIQSSGSKAADDSALAAIKKATPCGELPDDYPHQFLDLAYTFNYTADELTEVNHDKEE